MHKKNLNLLVCPVVNAGFGFGTCKKNVIIRYTVRAGLCPYSCQIYFELGLFRHFPENLCQVQLTGFPVICTVAKLLLSPFILRHRTSSQKQKDPQKPLFENLFKMHGNNHQLLVCV